MQLFMVKHMDSSFIFKQIFRKVRSWTVGTKGVYELGFARPDPHVSIPLGYVIINNVWFYT